MSLVTEVENWLSLNKIEDCKAKGLGKGCKGVELYLFKTTPQEFKLKYPMMDGFEYNGYFTEWHGRIYISMVRKKL